MSPHDHIESLSYMAIHKLGEALDVRDGRVGSKENREARFKGLTEEAEALVFAVQRLGSSEAIRELAERMTWVKERHDLYLADEKASKERRRARKAGAKP